MEYLILVINPGSTSTKIAVYKNQEELFKENIEHPQDLLASFVAVNDQLEMRTKAVEEILQQRGIHKADFSAVVGRGGLIPGLKTGGYLVNEAMKNRIINGPIIPHASNLGALIAHAIALPLGIPAYIYDAVSADDLLDVAKITGFPEIIRESFCHVLNTRATARKYAESQGKRYDQMNFIIAHLGGGISISAHCKGRIVDVITDDAGPFSPERAGSVPILYIIDMCYSGQYTKEELVRKQRGKGGLRALLGNSDCRSIEKMIEVGDEKAKLVYEAQVYQIAKGIGELSPTLNESIDAIILTGGVANSKILTGMITKRVSFIAPVIVMPGENEMEALAFGSLRIVKGEETARNYF